MDVFIARQPIFDKKQHVIAYELLYRANTQNQSNILNGDSATCSVVINSLLLMGLENLTDRKKAFINFTKNLINKEVPTVFSNEVIVVELLENIIPDEAFIEAVKSLKEKGYLIALDDFEADYPFPDLVELADIIKVDFLLNSSQARKSIVEKYKDTKIKFLAEKVETHDEFQEAIEQGYKYFQGYFFAKPKIVTGKDVQSIAVNHIKVISELNKETPEYNHIANIIESDLAMSYKLLRLINSAAFYTNSKITSINHALVLLGFREIRKWISLIMLRDLGIDKPQELVRLSLVRAKCMEGLANNTGMGERKTELFLMGMFSLIDTIMDRPMEEILNELPLGDEVKAGLKGESNIFKDVLNLVISYEKGIWDIFFKKCDRMKIERNVVPDVYVEALGWVTSIFDIN